MADPNEALRQVVREMESQLQLPAWPAPSGEDRAGWHALLDVILDSGFGPAIKAIAGDLHVLSQLAAEMARQRAGEVERKLDEREREA